MALPMTTRGVVALPMTTRGAVALPMTTPLMNTPPLTRRETACLSSRPVRAETQTGRPGGRLTPIGPLGFDAMAIDDIGALGPGFGGTHVSGVIGLPADATAFQRRCIGYLDTPFHGVVGHGVFINGVVIGNATAPRVVIGNATAPRVVIGNATAPPVVTDGPI